MPRPVINIDLDNVVYDFSKAMKGYAEFVLDRELPQSTQWAIWEDWGIPRGAFDFLFRRGVEEGFIWRTGDVIPGAIEGLWELSDQEFHIRLLTTRLTSKFSHDLAVSHTVEWLKENAIPYRSLAFIGGGESKSNYEAIALLDDNVENIQDWHDKHATGILFDQPWNEAMETAQVVTSARPLRVYNWDDALQVIKGVYGGK